jgi:hypothetical protein
LEKIHPMDITVGERDHPLTGCCPNPVLVTNIVFDEAERNLISSIFLLENFHKRPFNA